MIAALFQTFQVGHQVAELLAREKLIKTFRHDRKLLALQRLNPVAAQANQIPGRIAQDDPVGTPLRERTENLLAV